jgi:serpin B
MSPVRLVIRTLVLSIAVAGCSSCHHDGDAVIESPPIVSDESEPHAAVDDGEPAVDTATELPQAANADAAATDALVTSTNQFGFELYPHAAAQEGNVAVSPASISLALAMTWAGARGETAAQMANVLHFENADAVHAAAADLLRRWNDPERDAYELAVVNRLFGHESFTFEDAFLSRTRQSYGAPLERIDFAASEAARTHINGWVEGQTNDRIEDLLPPRSLDPDTRLVLVNAVYFLGKWVSPFERESTRTVPFNRAPGDSVQVATMHRMGSYRYAHRDGVKVLEIPYRGDDFAMTFLLPDDAAGLSALEQRLDHELVGSLVGDLAPTQVAVALPKFEIRPAGSLALAPTLREMGMPLAFQRGAADFTGIANPPSPDDRLFISEVFHQAFVKVDEDGTEAAAATAVVMARAGGAAMRPPEEFKADHPFLFLIRDVRSGMVFFIGRVADPNQRNG